MAPPRLQCLNTTRHVLKQGSGLRATFSTSHIARADDPPARAPVASDLLASLGENPTPPESGPATYKPIPVFTNPIELPGSLRKNLQGSKSGGALHRLLRRQDAIGERQGRVGGPSRSFNDIEELQKHNLAADLSRQITRRWKPGDVYAPHDLSEVEMAKWKKREKPNYDVFDVLDFNPLDHYRNLSIMSEYMTPMGRIMHSKETGLRPVNQRKIARAIRRSIGIGMTPSVHRHPEVIYQSTRQGGHQQLSPSKEAPL